MNSTIALFIAIYLSGALVTFLLDRKIIPQIDDHYDLSTQIKTAVLFWYVLLPILLVCLLFDFIEGLIIKEK